MVASTADSEHRSTKSPALGLRLLLLAALSVVLLVVDHRENHLDAVRKAVGTAVYPLRILVDAPVSTWQWIRDNTTSRNELLLEISRLNAERLLTHARLQRFTALESENARLRAMLDATSKVRDQVQVAEIMSVSSNPFRHILVINKGTRDGVFNGEAMIDADGVVGQVIEAGLLSSSGVLISDPDHALPVEVNRNGLRTIAVGTGDFDRLELPFLPNNADIEDGDLLVTSGLGGAFPPGYPVALVDSVTRIPQGPFAEVTARPAARLNQVREIMLISAAGSTGEEERPAEEPGEAESGQAETALPTAQQGPEDE
ncbi:MAG TPA: rod shape-determining protein MreC [Woeseiaceae bacterium]|nr:rod shape-determining protein MreC [Woeseiaceae bacterium]